MSSSETGSSFSRGSMPISRKTAFVETVKNQIIGFNTAAKNEIMPQTPFASFSLCFMAILLGTSSPKIRVKYERIIVISTTDTVLTVPVYFSEIPKVLIILAEKPSAKLSAAKAEPKKPAKVMPIWMVERKRVGSSIILSILAAFLSPSSASARTFFSFMDITAISVAAKNALRKIRISCNNSCFNICKNLPPFLIHKSFTRFVS